MQENPRFYELDLLRFLAALSVVFFHYTFLNTTILKSVPEYPFLEDVFKYGYLGVDLFFIISGFVILLTTEKKTAIEFTVSRIARLYPAFWIALSLTSLSFLFFGVWEFNNIDLVQYLINLTMVPEYFGVNNIDSVYWTLQIEIKFYFWIFVIMALDKIRYIERFLLVWLCLAILEIFHFFHGVTHLILIPEWAPYFSAGALFYRIRIYGPNWQRVSMLGLAYLLSVYYSIEGANFRTETYGSYFSPTVVAVIITLFFVVFTLMATKKIGHLTRSWFALIGVVTYPLYLIHDAIGQLIFHYFNQLVNKYVLLIMVTLFMIVASYLIYRYLEQGLSKKLKIWLGSKLGAINSKWIRG